MTVKQFNDICDDHINEQIDDINFLHTLLYTELKNRIGNDNSDEFFDMYYFFSVKV